MISENHSTGYLMIVAGNDPSDIKSKVAHLAVEISYARRGMVLGSLDFETEIVSRIGMNAAVVGVKSSATQATDERNVFSAEFPDHRSFFIAEELSEGYEIAGLSQEPLIELWGYEGVDLVLGLVAPTIEEAVATALWYGSETFSAVLRRDEVLDRLEFRFNGEDVKHRMVADLMLAA